MLDIRAALRCFLLGPGAFDDNEGILSYGGNCDFGQDWRARK
jgi:hypothetical protein